MISIIIPTLNEAEHIGRCLQSISGDKVRHEVIVVDGGSRDNTLKIAADRSDKMITSRMKNIGHQANLGAANAEGQILLFLHADSFLPGGALKKIDDCLGSNKHLVGGSFTMQVEGSRVFYKILSAGGNIFTWITRLYFGDRTIFIRKETFRKLSGFREIPIMEDVDLSRRMNAAGRTVFLKGPVITSSRNFSGEPFWNILYRIFWSISSYILGIDLFRIRKKYYGH